MHFNNRFWTGKPHCGTQTPVILGYFEDSNLDILIEATPKTKADIKGGTFIHLDGHLNLLEIAQVPQAHIKDFQDITQFPVFNTNNIWIRTSALLAKLKQNQPDLPLIVNPKKIDDHNIIQLETAMGAAIKWFKKSQILVVSRHRFMPVKTREDLERVRKRLSP